MTRPTTSRHDPGTVQLAVRVPRTLHQKFYGECAKRGITGSEMLRTMMERLVQLAGEQNG
jgi:hypothetical protein